MIIEILLLLVSFFILYLLRKKNIFKNTLFGIILINIVYILVTWLIKGYLEIFNLKIGIGILIFINLLFIFMSNKLSKKGKILLISTIIYFLIMYFVPVNKVEGHEHHFYDNTPENSTEKGFFVADYKEEIKEFSQYYNIYNMPIFKIYSK